MKRVGVLGSKGTVESAAFLSTEQFVKSVGQNTGNLIFQYATHKIIKSDKIRIGPDYFPKAHKIKDDVDVLVVPSANFIQESSDLTHFVNLLERSDVPLIFIGLGAQAADMRNEQLNLHPSVERLISLIKERSNKVSVRGEFTAKVLARFGVDHVCVTGCPSNFINPNKKFTQAFKASIGAGINSFITHAEEPWPVNPQKVEVERRLVDWTHDGRAIMVQQSVPKVLEYLRKSNSSALQRPSPDFEAELQNQLLPQSTIEQFRDFISQKVRNYISVEQWMEDSAKFDFSIGMRLHGNMAAWQAGTPALWISHDARTQELVETMALPYISVNEFLKRCTTLQEALEMWAFDHELYTRRRAALREELNSVLNAHDIIPAD